MRLERMNIQGFGAVRDKSLTIEAPVTVLYGPNEAGKSTVLYFIRAMLYGFPAKAHRRSAASLLMKEFMGVSCAFWMKRVCHGSSSAIAGPGRPARRLARVTVYIFINK